MVDTHLIGGGLADFHGMGKDFLTRDPAAVVGRSLLTSQSADSICPGNCSIPERIPLPKLIGIKSPNGPVRSPNMVNHHLSL
jgi:hypothetical protein